MNILFALLFLAPLHIYSQEVEASDILFLKIQELEGELASLRSELESQAYLIEKLLNEEPNQLDNNIPAETEINSKISTFRFEGINDSKSIDEVYDQAIFELNDKDFQAAKKSFNYLANNFSDDEKIPLSLFWLGEISLLESSLEESEKFFSEIGFRLP
jgi:TolA-binding protein